MSSRTWIMRRSTSQWPNRRLSLMGVTSLTTPNFVRLGSKFMPLESQIQTVSLIYDYGYDFDFDFDFDFDCFSVVLVDVEINSNGV
mmetsp:Transcript_9521/g.11970  ORF Transcript_9521/g.11970 Transcript_9521/m.11970 type:complete len:86 (+) Transcript_9521:1426-1683(+)